MKLSYETALKLKDAGFPQTVCDPMSYYDHKGRLFGWSEGEDEPGQTEWTKAPTLSELIEAVESTNSDFRFHLAKINPDEYEASTGFIAGENGIPTKWERHGTTPEEAGAALLLALNPKK